MKRMIAATTLGLALGLAMLTGAPALAEPDAKPATKTELIGANGQRVQALPMRYAFNAAWVIDTQRVLYRDDSRQHYLVTLKEACPVLAIEGRSVAFFPNPEWRLHTARSYEMRPVAGKPCDVAEIAKIATSAAKPMRESSLRRIW